MVGIELNDLKLKPKIINENVAQNIPANNTVVNLGVSGVLGGLFLGTAFTGFIFSITMTTAAVTLFMLAAMPFIAAIVGYFVLGEVLRRSTIISMIIAFIGVCIMIINDSISGSALGAFIGFISAT